MLQVMIWMERNGTPEPKTVQETLLYRLVTLSDLSIVIQRMIEQLIFAFVTPSKPNCSLLSLTFVRSAFGCRSLYLSQPACSSKSSRSLCRAMFPLHPPLASAPAVTVSCGQAKGRISTAAFVFLLSFLDAPPNYCQEDTGRWEKADLVFETALLRDSRLLTLNHELPI